MTTLVFNSYLEFLKREDKYVNGVSPDFAENNPNYAEENKTNKGCWNCSDPDNIQANLDAGFHLTKKIKK